MDEKKKLMVLGAMGVVLLGIGAFQFAKSSGSQPAPAAQSTVSKSADAGTTSTNGSQTGDQASPQQNDLVKGAYASRDPFKPLVDANAPVPSTTPTPAPTPTRVARNDGIPNFPGIDKTNGLPQPGMSSVGGKTVPVNPPAPESGYKLAGVIMGKKPAAVFIDAQGAQHLVQLGGSLDGDTQLVNLDRDHVVLRVKGQDKPLTLGGDSSAK